MPTMEDGARAPVSDPSASEDNGLVASVDLKAWRSREVEEIFTR
jgi:hypothetical protein